MTDLPVDRVTPDEPPFTGVGVDYFGQFEVKQAAVSNVMVWYLPVLLVERYISK